MNADREAMPARQQLDPGEGRPEAVVSAVPEGQVRRAPAGDVEAAGVGADRGVVVGGSSDGSPPRCLARKHPIDCSSPPGVPDFSLTVILLARAYAFFLPPVF